MDLKADVNVFAHDGSLVVKTEAPIVQSETLTRQIVAAAKLVPGVKEVSVDIVPRGTGELG
jgi:hypothetical protein